MKRSMFYAVAAGAAFAGSALMGTPASAAPAEQCDSALYPTKVELVAAGTSADTGLAPGTVVCIKAGTRTTVVTVDDAGVITQGAIMNKRGKAFLGISYYAFGDGGNSS